MRLEQGSGPSGLFVYCLILALLVQLTPAVRSAEQKIDLDGNPLNGAESVVETNVLQSFPVEIENVVHNNAAGRGFTFDIPGAGPGGFQSFVTSGPAVGTKWTWTTASQVYTIQSPAMFSPGDRELPVFGQHPGGVQGPASDMIEFTVPGKSIYPTTITVSDASLTSSLVTFFSPENTIASCESDFTPGRSQQTISNNTGQTVTFMVEEPDCCPEPQMTICDDGCKSYLTDDLNCGGCGIECAFDEFCDNGTCADICPGVGQELCNGTCVDTLNDDSNCGGCGVTCAFDEFCDAGTCADICPGVGQELCGGVCVDTLNDDSNCGACDVTCAFDEFCGGGTCGPICPGAGQAYCDGSCVDTLNDEANCGGCGVACAFDEFCDGGACADICPGAGEEYCGGVCVDTLNDDANCGGCGVACAFDEFCAAGTCADICPGVGQEYCAGACADTLTDLFNCGGCGVACAFDEFCDAGSCQPICPGLSLCGADCTDLSSDPLNCGYCGNTCAANSVCSGGECVPCRPPTGTNCNNVCVNTHTDPFNCGGCGMACDFSSCPSTGQGTCSQGDSCVCDPAAASGEMFEFSPVWAEVEAPDYSITATNLALRTSGLRAPAPRTLAPPPALPPAFERAGPAVELRQGKTAAGGVDLRGRLERSPGRIERTTAQSGVVEAPVCGIAPLALEIADGESFTLCQTGAVVGREIFTRATVMFEGQTIGRGPCALIVPAPEITVRPFEPSATFVTLTDETGDFLVQPGERVEAVIRVLNVGSGDMLNPVATLSSAPDQFNPLDVTFLNAVSVYGDFPPLDNPADCSTAPQLSPQTNTTNFVFTVPAAQEPDIGRVFNLSFSGNVSGTPSTVSMPVVIGIGDACDPAVDLDGETYDGLEGFLSPVTVQLVPRSYPPNVAPGTINQGSNVPLKVRLKCGDYTLGPDDFELSPQIVGITHDTVGALPLTNIKDTNSNPDNPFFDCGTNRCEFGLRTSGFPVGTITVAVRMPDSRVFHASIRLVP